MKVLIIDNYDSFTFNLYQYVGELLQQKENNFIIDVYRNDKITISEIKKKKYDRILISPGPGNPSDPAYFGVCKEVITEIGITIPVLGVCLGMQGIAYCFGGKVIRANKPMHGKVSSIAHDGKGVFKELPQNLEVMRYHSLVVENNSLPKCFEVSAKAKDTNEIMGIRHKVLPLEGIQFHPESFATEAGKQMLENFLFHSYE
jgi:anthranilate synthase component II